MDDVIERMAAGLYGQGPLNSSAEKSFSEACEHVRAHYLRQARAALRAVHDTHRLVPVEPTKEMQESMLHQVARFDCFGAYQKAIEAAPVYTEAADG